MKKKKHEKDAFREDFVGRPPINPISKVYREKIQKEREGQLSTLDVRLKQTIARSSPSPSWKGRKRASLTGAKPPSKDDQLGGVQLTLPRINDSRRSKQSL